MCNLVEFIVSIEAHGLDPPLNSVAENVAIVPTSAALMQHKYSVRESYVMSPHHFLIEFLATLHEREPTSTQLVPAVEAAAS